MRAIALALGLNHPVQKLDVAKYMYGQPLQDTPGTNSAYSNYGYLLLSAIVEQVTGTAASIGLMSSTPATFRHKHRCRFPAWPRLSAT
jgi:hypothetical protein